MVKGSQYQFPRILIASKFCPLHLVTSENGYLGVIFRKELIKSGTKLEPRVSIKASKIVRWLGLTISFISCFASAISDNARFACCRKISPYLFNITHGFFVQIKEYLFLLPAGKLICLEPVVKEIILPMLL